MTAESPSLRVVLQLKDFRFERASPAIASPPRPEPDSHAHSAISPRMTPDFARHDQRNLFADAALRFHQSATPSTAYFKGFHPPRKVNLLIIQSDENVKMVGHDYVGADPRAVLRAFFSEADKSLVNGLCGQYRAAIICACRYKVDRCADEHPIEATQPLLANFGGHRPPLQR